MLTHTLERAGVAMYLHLLLMGGIASQMGLVGMTPTQKPIDLREWRGLTTTTAINSHQVDEGGDIRSDHGQALLETEMERLKEDFWLSLGKSGSLPLKPTLRREDIITEDRQLLSLFPGTLIITPHTSGETPTTLWSHRPTPALLIGGNQITSINKVVTEWPARRMKYEKRMVDGHSIKSPVLVRWSVKVELEVEGVESNGK